MEPSKEEPTAPILPRATVFAECEKAIAEAIRAALNAHPDLSHEIEKCCHERILELQMNRPSSPAGF